MAECAAAQMRKAGAQQIEDIDAGWRKWSGHSGCSSLTPASAEHRLLGTFQFCPAGRRCVRTAASAWSPFAIDEAATLLASEAHHLALLAESLQQESLKWRCLVEDLGLSQAMSRMPSLDRRAAGRPCGGIEGARRR